MVSKLRIIQVDSFGGRSGFLALLQPLPHIKRYIRYLDWRHRSVLLRQFQNGTARQRRAVFIAAVWNSDT
jgi:hypothetical protein